MTGVSLMKVGWTTLRLMAARLEMMRLGKKVEICLSPKRQSWAFSHLELEWPLAN